VGKKQNFCAKDCGTEIALLVCDTSPLTPRRPLNESEPANSPGAIRRDNIDGCESEKDSSDIGERTNAGFSGDEDEDRCVFKSEDHTMKDLTFALNHSSKDSHTCDPANNIMFNTNICASQDAKEELESNESDAIVDPNGNFVLNLKSLNGPLGTKPHRANDHFGATVDQHIAGPTVSDHNDTPEISTPVVGRDHFSVPKQDDATVLRSDPILEPTTEGVEIPLKNLTFNTVIDDNDNFPNPKGVEKSNLAGRNSELNHSLEKTGTIASQDEENMNSSDRTTDSCVYDAGVEAKALVFKEESAKDAPAYKTKLERKKDKKKNGRIEKTFFV